MITNPIVPIWIMGLVCIIFMVIKSKDRYSLIRKIIIMALLFIINLRMMIPSDDVEVLTNDLDVLFVIDNTISMTAEDYDGGLERLIGVKENCEYIIDELSGANFSVITFNNTSRIVTPYTKDINLTMEAINTIQVMDEFYARGSSLNIVIEDMLYSLEVSTKKPERTTIVFFISDGEITNEDTLQSFSDAKKHVDNGAVLGYGTKKGGRMASTVSWEGPYMLDKTEYPFVEALSKIDENNLKQIAKDMGIDYIHMEKKSDIDYKIKQIKQQMRRNMDDEGKSAYIDIYYIFVFPLCLLLIYEFINHKRRCAV